MRVKMRLHIGGARNGRPWPLAGEVLECSEHEGLSLVGNGSADLVPEVMEVPEVVFELPEVIVETAEVAPMERAAYTRKPEPRKPGRPRKVVFPKEG